MQVIINYDQVDKVYKLYNKDFDVLLESPEMFKVLVMFNGYLMSKLDSTFNILKSDGIDYILDSPSMKQIILSNVKLLKKLNQGASGFQLSSSKFGNTTSSSSFPASFNKSTNPDIKDFNDMMSTNKKFKTNKFNKFNKFNK